MSYTFNLKSEDADDLSVSRIRNSIDDKSSSSADDGGKEGVDYFLSDTRILGFLLDARDEAPTDANATEVRLWAAAAAESTLAKNQAFVLKKQTTMGEGDDGPAVAAAIEVHAKSLAARAWKSLTDRRALLAQAQANANKIQAPRSGSFKLETVI